MPSTNRQPAAPDEEPPGPRDPTLRFHTLFRRGRKCGFDPDPGIGELGHVGPADDDGSRPRRPTAPPTGASASAGRAVLLQARREPARGHPWPLMVEQVLESRREMAGVRRRPPACRCFSQPVHRGPPLQRAASLSTWMKSPAQAFRPVSRRRSAARHSLDQFAGGWSGRPSRIGSQRGELSGGVRHGLFFGFTFFGRRLLSKATPDVESCAGPRRFCPRRGLIARDTPWAYKRSPGLRGNCRPLR